VLSNLEAHARAVPGSRSAGLDRVPFPWCRGGAPEGKANGAYKHGFYTAEVVKERRLLSDLIRQSRRAIAALQCEGKE
jgi:hypothetical protein